MDQRTKEIIVILKEFFDESDNNIINIISSNDLDSLTMVELVLFIENRFKIEIFVEDIVQENFMNINTILEFVVKKLDDMER